MFKILFLFVLFVKWFSFSSMDLGVVVCVLFFFCLFKFNYFRLDSIEILKENRKKNGKIVVIHITQ